MRSNFKIDLKRKSFAVFNDHLGYCYPGGRVIPGKNISNPFLPYKQNTPSFNVFKAPDGSFIYKDFATGEKGNCVTFLSKLKNIDRIEAFKKIIFNY